MHNQIFNLTFLNTFVICDEPLVEPMSGSGVVVGNEVETAGEKDTSFVR